MWYETYDITLIVDSCAARACASSSSDTRSWLVVWCVLRWLLTAAPRGHARLPHLVPDPDWWNGGVMCVTSIVDSCAARACASSSSGTRSWLVEWWCDVRCVDCWQLRREGMRLFLIWYQILIGAVWCALHWLLTAAPRGHAPLPHLVPDPAGERDGRVSSDVRRPRAAARQRHRPRRRRLHREDAARRCVRPHSKLPHFPTFSRPTFPTPLSNFPTPELSHFQRPRFRLSHSPTSNSPPPLSTSPLSHFRLSQSPVFLFSRSPISPLPTFPLPISPLPHFPTSNCPLPHSPTSNAPTPPFPTPHSPQFSRSCRVMSSFSSVPSFHPPRRHDPCLGSLSSETLYSHFG